MERGELTRLQHFLWQNVSLCSFNYQWRHTFSNSRLCGHLYYSFIYVYLTSLYRLCMQYSSLSKSFFGIPMWRHFWSAYSMKVPNLRLRNIGTKLCQVLFQNTKVQKTSSDKVLPVSLPQPCILFQHLPVAFPSGFIHVYEPCTIILRMWYRLASSSPVFN